jgi:hypothetical protein
MHRDRALSEPISDGLLLEPGGSADLAAHAAALQSFEEVLRQKLAEREAAPFVPPRKKAPAQKKAPALTIASRVL